MSRPQNLRYKHSSFQKTILGIVSLFIVSTVFLVKLLQVQASTGINQTINFQGKLLQTNNLNVRNGTYSIVFTLYNAETGGGQIWQETQSSVTTTDGVFRVALGSVSSIGGVDFNQDSLWLGVKVGSDPEMSPRIRFTAVPYAFQAKKVQLSGLTNPSANTDLSMSSYSMTFRYNESTGSTNLFNLTDSKDNSGNGYLLNITTAENSSLNPFHVSAAGTEALTVDAEGNVGIGETRPGQKLAVNGTLGIIEGGSNATYHTIFQGGDQNLDITYTLPSTQAAASGYVLANDGSGVLSWTSASSLGGTKWNSISNPDGNQSLTMGGYTSTWSWDSLTSGTGLTASSSSLSSGTLASLSVNSTAAAANAQKVLNISNSGVNGTSGQTTYGSYTTNTHTGTSSTNIAGYFSASGGTNNYAGIFENGSVGIGTTAPSGLLSVGSSSQFSVTSGGAVTAVGVNSGSGLVQGTGGLTVTGIAQINATGTATTTIGSSSAGALSLASGGASNLTVTGANLTISTATSGTLALDSAGSLTIGNTTATGITLGRTGITTTNAGALTSTQTLTASNGLTLSTGALNLTGTSGSIALTGFGTSSITSTTTTGNINTLSDSSFAVAGGSTGNLANLTFTNGSVNTTGTSTTSGLNIAPTNNAAGSGGTMETYGVRIQDLAGSAGAGTQNNYGIRIGNQGLSNTELAYGLYVDSQSGSTTNYSIFSAGGTNYFAGNVGIGTTNPSTAFAVGSSSQFNVTSAGAVTAVGVNSGSGLIQGTGGLTVTGTTQINATGSGTTTIGSSSAGAITLASGGASSFNVIGANLTLQTNTSGNIVFTSAGDVNSTLGSGTNNFNILTGNLKLGDGTPTIAQDGEDAYIEGIFEVDGLSTFGGNVGIGSTNPGQKLTVEGTFGILEGGTSPSFHTIFQGGDQSGDITYTLPIAQAGGSGYVLTNTSGTLSWTAPGSISTKWNNIASPDGNQSLTMGSNTSTWTWDSLTSGTGLTASSSSLSSGTLASLSVNSTAAGSNTQKVLNLSTAGANSTSGQTTYGSYVTNTHTGTSSTNVAGYFSASGGSSNYAAIFETGNVGIGTTAPGSLLSVGSTSQFTVSSAGALVAVGVNSGSGLIQGTGGMTVTGTTQINATGSGTTTIGSSSAGALTLASDADSTFTVTTGNLTISTATSGTLALDSAGSLTIGNTNATGITLGRTGVTTTNAGALTSTQTLTASNGLTLTTGALNLTATSGSIALTGFGTSSITSTTTTGNINTFADSSFAVAASGTGNLANLTFTNGSVNTSGTAITTGLNIAATNNAAGSGGTMETYGIRLQDLAGTAGAGTQKNYGIMIGNYGRVNTEEGYGLYIDAQTGSGTNYSIYSAGGTNYFAGNVGIGTTNPSTAFAVGSSSQFNVTSAGAITAVGLNAGSGLIQGTGGLTVTGTAQINATGSGTTTIGSSSAGAISLASGSGSSFAVTGANLTLQTNTSGNIVLTSAGDVNSTLGSGTNNFNVLTGNLRVGNATPLVTQDGEDTLLEGDVETQGTLRIGTQGVSSYQTSNTLPYIYSASTGGTYPFTDNGSLVIQPRTSLPRDIVFATGTTTPSTRMVVDRNGNVGIGSTSPTAKFQVVNTGNAVKIGDASGTDVYGTVNGVDSGASALTVGFGILGTSGNDNAWFGSTTNHDTAIRSNNTVKVTVKAGGNVGVGTTNPGGLFAVGSSSQFNVSSAGALVAVGVNSGSGLIQGTGGMTVTGTTQINATGSGTTTIGSSSAGAIALASGAASSFNVTSANLTLQTNTSGNLVFTSAADINSTLGSGTGNFNVLTGNLRVGSGTPTITQDGEDAYIEGQLETDGNATFGGNVGIGTTSTAAKLVTYESTDLGSTLANNQILARISGRTGLNWFMDNLWLYRDTESGTNWTTTRLHDGISIDSSFGTPGTDTKTWWERDPGDNIQSWGDAANTYLTIKSGNVGIGTTSPGSLLSVGSSSQFTVSSAGAVVGVGVNSGSGLLQGTGGLTLTGTTSINASGAGTTTIGSSSAGALVLASGGASSFTVTGANLTLQTTTSGNIVMTSAADINATLGSGTGNFNILTGNLRVGNGTPSITQDGEDTYLEGAFEVDGLSTFGGNVGIGSTSPGSKLDVSGNVYISGIASLGDAPSAGQGLRITSSVNTATSYGVYSSPVFGGTTSSGWGVGAFPNGGANALTNIGSFVARAPYFSSGSSTNSYGLYVENLGSASVTNAYGLYITSQSGASTLNYALYSAGGTNYFGGNVGIGITSPTDNLSVSPNSAPTVTIGNRAMTFGGTGTIGTLAWKDNGDLSTTGGTITVSKDTVSSFADHSMHFSVTGSEKFTIYKNGNVGVGTTTPGGLFAVGSSSQFTVSSAGAVVGVGVNSGSGLLQGTGGLTLTGTASINATGSSATTIGSATSDTTVGGQLILTQVTDNQSLTSTQTRSLTTKGSMFNLSNDIATTNANVTVTFDLTGITATDGTVIWAYLNPKKGVTASAGTVQSCIQFRVNSSSDLLASAICTPTQNAASTTVFAIVQVLRQNGTWRALVKNTAATADLAEWIPYAGVKPQSGEIVSTANNPVKVERSTKAYDSAVVGIISTDPNTVMGGEGGDDQVILGLSGRVPVKVTTESGAIKPGDFITSSSIQGIGMKAVKAGTVVGKALDSFDGEGIGTVTVLMNLTWYDPDVYLTSTGDMTVDGTDHTVKKSDGTVITRMGAFAEAVIGKVTSASITVDDITLSGKKLSETLATVMDDLSGIKADIKTIKENGDSGSDASMSAQLYDIKNSLHNSISQISADLSDLEIRQSETQAHIASMEANLAMLNENILGASTVNASGSGSLLSPDQVATVSALTVTGNTNLYDLGVTGTITAGTMVIDGLNSSISTLGVPLQIQPDGLFGIDFLGGKIALDKKGNIKVQEGHIEGNETFRGRVIMPSGTKTIRVQKTWDKAPQTINITSTFNSKIWIEGIDSTGFTVKVDEAPGQDAELYWVALW